MTKRIQLITTDPYICVHITTCVPCNKCYQRIIDSVPNINVFVNKTQNIHEFLTYFHVKKRKQAPMEWSPITLQFNWAEMGKDI